LAKPVAIEQHGRRLGAAGGRVILGWHEVYIAASVPARQPGCRKLIIKVHANVVEKITSVE